MGQPDFALGGTSIYAGGTLPAAPTGGSFTSSSTDLYCTPSFALGDYVWFIKINVGGGSDITPATYPLVSVVQTLVSSSFLN